jgi:hypothetical protein
VAPGGCLRSRLLPRQALPRIAAAAAATTTTTAAAATATTSI